MKTSVLTVEQYRALAEKQNNGKSNRHNKYNARKTGAHASKKEHTRANELKLMQRAGLITNLREQVRYLLIPGQKNGDRVERPCYYIADFVYEDVDGNLVVEDTKGFRTPEYVIKRKLMLSVHGITIKEI